MTISGAAAKINALDALQRDISVTALGIVYN